MGKRGRGKRGRQSKLYRKNIDTCLILYFRKKFYINNIIICTVMKREGEGERGREGKREREWERERYQFYSPRQRPNGAATISYNIFYNLIKLKNKTHIWGVSCQLPQRGARASKHAVSNSFLRYQNAFEKIMG